MRAKLYSADIQWFMILLKTSCCRKILQPVVGLLQSTALLKPIQAFPFITASVFSKNKPCFTIAAGQFNIFLVKYAVCTNSYPLYSFWRVCPPSWFPVKLPQPLLQNRWLKQTQSKKPCTTRNGKWGPGDTWCMSSIN